MAPTAAQPVTADPKPVLPDFTPLTEESIKEQTDAGSFSRGRGYFRSQHIFGAFRRGNTLHARSHGSSGGPYVVEATLAAADIPQARNPVSYLCTCPRGGFCKHIVAMLLTWIDRPESFEVRPALAEILAGKSQDELVALIERMVRAVPELEKMIELPPAVVAISGDEPVNEATIRRQIAAAMKDDGGYEGSGSTRYDGYYPRGRYGYDYDAYDGFDDEYDDAGTRAAGKLEPLATLAEAYVQAGHWRHAFQVSATLAEELAPQLEFIDDENGALDELIVRADAVLAASLDAQGELPDKQRFSATERRRLIDCLMLIWQTGLDEGRLDLSQAGPEAIARGATAAEQREIGELLRQALHSVQGDGSHQTWQKRSAMGFLSLLSGEAGLSDEELLTEYRNAELWEEAAHTLVRMERVDEALALVARHVTTVAALTNFADRLVETGDTRRIEQAIALVDDRLWEHEGKDLPTDQTLREWLERRHAEQGQPEKALEMAQSRFKASPTRQTYEAVKTAADLPGQPGDPWPALRPKLIVTLSKCNEWYTLIDIHLAEGEIAEAIAALKTAENPSKQGASGYGSYYGWGYGDHQERVAAAAEADFPDEAIRIYRKRVDRMIDERKRTHYQQAAEYLARVKRVLEAKDRAAEWPPLIAEVRQSNKSLRALREELDALGLG